LSKLNTIQKSSDFKTYKINNEIISINDWYLTRFNNKSVDTLTYFDNDVQGFQIGNSFYFIDERKILSEIIIYNSSRDTSKILIKKIDYLDKYIRNAGDVNVYQDRPKDDVFIIVGDKLYRLIIKDNKFNFELLLNNLPSNEYYKFVQFDKATQTIL
jgi:hypothetical protein